MRVFARMQTSEDFDLFIEGLSEEMKLRNRLAQLQEYYRMGITTIENSKEYDKAKEKRLHTKTTSQGFDNRPIQQQQRRDKVLVF
jgi:transcriptional adapter 2-alpha